MNNAAKTETRVFSEDDFRRMCFDRARTLGASGEVKNSVHPSAIMATGLYIDCDGHRWEVGKSAPFAEGKNTVVYLFVDDDRREFRAYCVPTKEHPGALTRYRQPRTKEPGAKCCELIVDRTDNLELFAACIAYELRAVDAETPPIKIEDEITE